MIELLNIDCMAYMATLPDKAFDLAIVDPPYGIGAAKEKPHNGWKDYGIKSWDNCCPDKYYFNELFRVSKNQIIWGGNYMTKYLPHSSCWIVWNKIQRGFSLSDGELAWSSFQSALKIFDYARGNDSGFAPKLKYHERAGINIHPTQKPVKLYKWLLHNYAKQGDKILDTHLGSGSSAIACHDMGFDLVGCEIDKDYYEAACKRFKEQTMQLKLIA